MKFAIVLHCIHDKYREPRDADHPKGRDAGGWRGRNVCVKK